MHLALPSFHFGYTCYKILDVKLCLDNFQGIVYEIVLCWVYILGASEKGVLLRSPAAAGR